MQKGAYDFSKETGQAVFQLMKEAKDIEQYKRMQAIYFRASYKEKAPKIAQRTGLAVGTIWNIHSRWRREGMSIFQTKDTGGRLRENLSFEEEVHFLEQFKTAGERGGILEVSVIYEAYKKHVAEDAALSTVYRILDRHDWRKITPRPRHPQGNLAAQEAFKKSGQSSSSKVRKKPKQSGNL